LPTSEREDVFAKAIAAGVTKNVALKSPVRKKALRFKQFIAIFSGKLTRVRIAGSLPLLPQKVSHLMHLGFLQLKVEFRPFAATATNDG